MANSVYFRNCLEAIRHTVYGRDNRKPIADAIQQIDTFHRADVRKYAEEAIQHCNELDPTLTEMKRKLQRALGSVMVEPMETWYTYDYRDIELQTIQNDDSIAQVVTNQMSIDSLSVASDDYEVIDEVSDDFAQTISEDSYMWVVPNPVKEIHVHHGEDYILIITRINGN